MKTTNGMATIGICMAFALPCVTLADAPSAAAVGQLDAILAYCSRIEPGLERDAKTFQSLVTGSAAPSVRSSAPYKQEFEATTAALAKTDRHEVSAACVNSRSRPGRPKKICTSTGSATFRKARSRRSTHLTSPHPWADVTPEIFCASSSAVALSWTP